MKALAIQFADALIGLTKAYYCCGDADANEFRAATLDFVDRWADLQRQRIPPGTVCPYRR